MGRMTKKIKDHAEELYDTGAYEEARDDSFNTEFRDMFVNKYKEMDFVTQEDIQGFLDSFTFPDEEDWCMNEAESAYDDLADALYEQMRDERQ